MKFEFYTTHRQNRDTLEYFGNVSNRLGLISNFHFPYEYLKPHIVYQFIIGFNTIDLQTMFSSNIPPLFRKRFV